MTFDTSHSVLGIAGIVEIDLDVRLVIWNSLAGLGPIGVPAFMPELAESIRVERVLCPDVVFDQLPVVQELTSERKLARAPEPGPYGGDRFR